MRRPCFPSQKSDFFDNSSTLKSRKNSGVTRRASLFGDSLAPFRRTPRATFTVSSGHAHRQSKPLLLTASRVLKLRDAPISRHACLTVATIEGTPPRCCLSFFSSLRFQRATARLRSNMMPWVLKFRSDSRNRHAGGAQVCPPIERHGRDIVCVGWAALCYLFCSGFSPISSSRSHMLIPLRVTSSSYGSCFG